LIGRVGFVLSRAAALGNRSGLGFVIQRRLCLRLLGAGAALWLLSGHSPYRQWDVYRKTRLVLLVSAADQTSARFGQALVAIYGKRLPESRATSTRARDVNDLVRLIASKQLEVALMREGDAYAALTGAAPFADNGRVPLRTLGALGDHHLLVCREEVPDAAAFMLVEALAEQWAELDKELVRQATGPKPAQSLRVPLHAGAAEYYKDHA
jgi:TRAP-type uncharacterized transport system substrate-binding protein